MTCTWCARFGVESDHALRMAGVQTVEGEARKVRRGFTVVVYRLGLDILDQLVRK